MLIEPTQDAERKTYPITEQLRARLDNTFRYHAPNPDQLPRYQDLREKARELAYTIVALTPPGREQSMALTALEECVMHANAAIARNEARP